MNTPQKTSQGFVVCRRCDFCGTKIRLVVDSGDRCTLKCQQCGKEYRFHHHKAA